MALATSLTPCSLRGPTRTVVLSLPLAVVGYYWRFHLFTTSTALGGLRIGYVGDSGWLKAYGYGVLNFGLVSIQHY